jgi:acyl-CoA synthetase (AMP-forming)/AMP-acid ligase II
LIDNETKMRRYNRNGDTAVTLFEQTVKKHPDKLAIIMIDERKWTFRELDLFSNQVANYFYEQVQCSLIGLELIVLLSKYSYENIMLRLLAVTSLYFI